MHFAELGIDGTVNIRAPVTNVSGTFAPLPQSFGRAAGAAAAGCVRSGCGVGSAVVLSWPGAMACRWNRARCYPVHWWG